jgi:hypothetical protein
LGLNKDNDSSEISPKEKEQFARFTNILISWDENIPINLDTIWNMNVTFISDKIWKNWTKESLDKLALSSYINNKMWSNPFSIISYNLDKYFNNKSSGELDKNKQEVENYLDAESLE